MAYVMTPIPSWYFSHVFCSDQCHCLIQLDQSLCLFYFKGTMILYLGMFKVNKEIKEHLGKKWQPIQSINVIYKLFMGPVYVCVFLCVHMHTIH